MDYENHKGVMRSGKIALYNMDCMEALRQTPDKYYELCVVDPPYGIGMDGQEWNNTPTGKPSIKGKSKGIRVQKKSWDSAVPMAIYWSELRRISEHQIVWGGNYFTDNLPQSRGWVCWDKKQPDGLTFSQFELAWTSFDEVGRTFRMYPTHVAQGVKIHPTQKPVALYEWLLTNYAKPGDRILDTHLGSGSSAIAAHNLGFDFVGMELDADYYQAAVKRFEQHKAQARLFDCDDYQRTERDYQQDSLL